MHCPKQSKTIIYLPSGYRPNENDILCGRGKSNSDRRGNKVFHQIINANMKRYIESDSRVKKSVIVTNIVCIIEDVGMKFLELNSDLDQYAVLSTDRAHAKVGHAIRDVLKKRRKQAAKTTGPAKLQKHTKQNIVPDRSFSSPRINTSLCLPTAALSRQNSWFDAAKTKMSKSLFASDAALKNFGDDGVLGNILKGLGRQEEEGVPRKLRPDETKSGKLSSGSDSMAVDDVLADLFGDSPLPEESSSALFGCKDIGNVSDML